jgi:hypothetical protein
VKFARILPLAAAAILAVGCSTIRTSDPARTATEQLLVATAADRAAQDMDLAALAGKKVFLDPAHLEGADKGYALGAVARRLAGQDARLVAERKQADVAITVHAGALSVDRAEFLIGIPEMAVPVPLAGPLHTPELALFKRDGQTGIARLALNATDSASGERVLSPEPASGTAHFTLWKILLIPFRRSDVPEKKPKYPWLPG